MRRSAVIIFIILLFRKSLQQASSENDEHSNVSEILKEHKVIEKHDLNNFMPLSAKSCKEHPNTVLGCSECLEECIYMYDYDHIANKKCKKGCAADTCICKEGFYYNSKIKRCVEPDDCDCGDDPNATPGCQDCSLTCNVMRKQREAKCKPCDSDNPGCRCKKGYWKDTTRNACVLPDDCSCNGDPNAIIGCLHCLKTCDTMFDPLDECTSDCVQDTCICRHDYFNDTNIIKCVEADDCPAGDDPNATPGCQECKFNCNEMHSDNINTCTNIECDKTKHPSKCKIGYAMDTTRQMCVKPNDCSCRDDWNAVVGCSVCSRKCERTFDLLKNCVKGCTIDDCICREGYFYDNKAKKCVVETECSCGDDPNSMPGCEDCKKTCNLLQGVEETNCSRCDKTDPGCKCRAGFVKDTVKKLCVRMHECSCYGDPNAVFGCPACYKQCDRMYEPLVNCTEGCYVDTCICREEYFNDTKNNKCVLAEDCPCGLDPNAMPGCQEYRLTCPGLHGKVQTNFTTCINTDPVCKCKPGYALDITKYLCVKRDECSCGDDANSVLGCQDCRQTCHEVHREPDTGLCQPCATDSATYQCKCRDGYLLDTIRGFCVIPNDCSCNGDPNAIFGCINCLVKCDTMFNAPGANCMDQCSSKQAFANCICRRDYYLDTEKDKCVEEENCPCGDDPKATPGCQDCELTCYVMQGLVEPNCIPCDKDNPGCKCKVGYVKDTTRDLCVRSNDCSCNGDPNTVFGCSTCLKTCDTMFEPLTYCKPGCAIDSCICLEAFFNDTKTKKCVNADDCDCGADPLATPGCQSCNLTCNAHYNLAETNCFPCDRKNPGCKCKRGFLKDTRWEMCVAKEDCSCSEDPNSVHGCHDCKNTCNTFHGREETEFCLPCDVNNPGCKCKKGYLKDTARGICVKSPDCACNGDPNAIVGCFHCLIRCDTIFVPQKKNCQDECNQQQAFDSCICRNGYFLDTKTDRCVKENDCSCGEDPNAAPGCLNCSETCNAVHSKPETNCTACPAANPGCKCKIGFVKDTARDLCSIRKNCSCNGDPNAVYGCSVCLKTCDIVLNPDSVTCNKKRCFVNACICRDGYFMDTEKKICKDPVDCPCGPDPNASPGCDECYLICNLQNGNEPPVTVCNPCDSSNPGCRCKPGYLKDTRWDKCVKPTDCSCGDDPNAVNGCQNCSETCNALTGNIETNCPPCDVNNPGCTCLSGYVKDTTRNLCVKRKYCYDHKAAMRLDDWTTAIIVMSVATGLFSFGFIFALLWRFFHAILKPVKIDMPLKCECEEPVPIPSNTSCECK